MKTRLLFPLLLIILNMGCIEDDEKEDEVSNCAAAMMRYLEETEEAYYAEIAEVRNPDGTFYTLEQCQEQREIAQEYLVTYEEKEEEFNGPYFSQCSDKEKFDINNIFERLILEMETDVVLTYDCD
ncbi:MULTISPECIES: hypothetical protein [Zobellia]|uniref:Hypothetical lipoprotein n=1 Tax=Zobellia galactanivorans (strain DSM 12802 / CCUG 47099 / CIP 106680 / NCIMB 13871 / Dsij) TaxID=63186 RepID=G0L067_ZOBGA|nr:MULTISPECIES: hypothetical protein [Zobellia]CAZ94155.1 Hypothetical lipoprotein [Zobellia galactanivorans]